MRYIATVYSNSTHEREYEFNSRSAINAANLYGRCESGEVVTVRTLSGREISRAVSQNAASNFRLSKYPEISCPRYP